MSASKQTMRCERCDGNHWRQNCPEIKRGALIRSSELVSWCVWKLDEWHGYYDTDCGEAYCFEDGRPRENHYRYCPGCGRKLRTTPLTPANNKLCDGRDEKQ